ncbi:MAG: hypothetical protein ACR2IE_02740 [Candidatus Sumerlaeaceae bacterium]
MTLATQPAVLAADDSESGLYSALRNPHSAIASHASHEKTKEELEAT